MQLAMLGDLMEQRAFATLPLWYLKHTTSVSHEYTWQSPAQSDLSGGFPIHYFDQSAFSIEVYPIVSGGQI